MNPTEHDNSARTFNLNALRADAERYGLRPEDLDALRELREDPEEHARRVLYRAHYAEVRAQAADILGDVLSGSIAGPEALDERLHEEADGSRSVFTYAGALRTVYASEEWEAGPDELGFADFAAGAESVPELMTRAAYWALRADLRDRLGLLVSHPPAPGSDEARELGFDADSLDGLDLSDGDTFPANRTESEDPAEDGPNPEDYVVSSNGFRLSVSIVEGEHVGEFAEHKDAERAIREHRARTSPEFYPEVWSISDHGNVSRYSEHGFAWDGAQTRCARCLAWGCEEHRSE